MAKQKQAVEEVVEASMDKFTKEQILQSKKYSKIADIINVVLEEEKYTLEEVDKKIDNFRKKEVKVC